MPSSSEACSAEGTTAADQVGAAQEADSVDSVALAVAVSEEAEPQDHGNPPVLPQICNHKIFTETAGIKTEKRNVACRHALKT